MATEKKQTQNLGKALSKAESIIAAAEERAEKILSSAEATQAEAREQGYKEGLEIAKEEVGASAVRMIEESSLINDRLSSEAAKLAVAICSAVIGEHIRVEPDTVIKIAHKALRESVVGNSATIIVNPQDEQNLNNSLQDFAQLANGASINIQTSTLISPGGCLVKTEFGEVDAQIDSLIRVIAQRLGILSNGR